MHPPIFLYSPMLKLSNFFFNIGLFVLLIFISLCWALDNVEIWVRSVLVPVLAVTTGLGLLFKVLAKKRGEAEEPKKSAPEQD